MSDKPNITYSADYSSLDLFDRIINIKFTRRDGDTITIRSDYEEVWDGNNLSFKICQPKPEIRVQYIQYQRTLINVDIYITNFNIIEAQDEDPEAQTMANIASAVTELIGKKVKSGTTNQPNETYSYDGNPVVKAEIAMGYRGQFYRWDRWTGKGDSQVEAYKAFKNLELPATGNSPVSDILEQFVDGKYDDQAMFTEIRRCNIVIEWAAAISNPPNRIMQYHGYVGSVESGFQPFALYSLDCPSETGAIGKVRKKDIMDGVDDEYDTVGRVKITALAENKYNTNVVEKLSESGTALRNFFNGGNGFTLLEAYCFNFITRRYPKSTINLVRDEDVENAVLDFYMESQASGTGRTQSGSTPPSAVDTMTKIITQDVYRTANNFWPQFFEENRNGDLDFVKVAKGTKVVPTDKFKQDREKEIRKLLLHYYVGVRYTLKDLPKYHIGYDKIRETLKSAYAKGDRMSWWEAARNLDIGVAVSGVSSTEGSETVGRVKTEQIDNTVYDYVAKSENGTWSTGKSATKTGVPLNAKFVEKDTYIVPTQSVKGSVLLYDSEKNPVRIKIPGPPPPGGGTVNYKKNGKFTTTIKVFAGMFEVRDAYMFGVPVLCSQKASEHFKKRIGGDDYIPIEFMADLGAQIKWICDAWGFIYFKMHNGGFYICLPNESARDITGQLFVTDQAKAPFRIPAIYDITLSPLRVIRMPFVAFLDPMTLVEWNTRTAIGKMISFYYQPEIGRNFFTVISCTVDFATTGDQNMEELQLVDAQWTDPKQTHIAVQETDTVKDTYIECIIIPDSNMNTWEKIYNSPVCRIPGTAVEWYNKVKPKDETILEMSPDHRISPIAYFEMTREFNPSLFNEAVRNGDGTNKFSDQWSRIDNTANKLYWGEGRRLLNFPEIEYCMSVDGFDTKLRRIYLRFPMMPLMSAYSGKDAVNVNDKLVLVYENGLWETREKTEYSKTFTIGIA